MLKRLQWLNAVVLLLCAAMLLGCAAQPVSSSSGVQIGRVVLDVQVWASTGCVQPGQSVRVRATVSNRGSEPEVVALKDKPVLDIIIGSPDTGRRWSEGQALTPELTQLELKPGQSKSIEMEYKAMQTSNVWVSFIESDKPANHPVRTSVLVNVDNCPGPLGP